MIKFLAAVLILSGMIIGIGILGIPYVFAQAGFWVGAFELAILAGVVTLFHLLYADIVIATPAFHRMPGYVRTYLGKRAAFLSWASAFFGISGTLLAYILIGSIFLNAIFLTLWKSSSEIFWAIVVIVLGAIITVLPLKRETLINGILTLVLIVSIIVLSVVLLPEVDYSNLAGADFSRVFIPYGVLLFALSGGIVIPDLIAFLGRGHKKIRSAIIIGTLIPAVLYFLFAFVIVGSFGDGVREEAISSLGAILGSRIVIFGSAIGFLAAFTSYIVLTVSFRELLRLDFGMRRWNAWVFSLAIPAALFMLGFQNFIAVIGAVGALAVGVDSVLILAAHHSMRRREGAKFGWFSCLWKCIIYLMIMAGVAYELYKTMPFVSF